MHDAYLKRVIVRGNELALLERAAALYPEKTPALRWLVAAALGALASLIPSVCTAQAFLLMI